MGALILHYHLTGLFGLLTKVALRNLCYIIRDWTRIHTQFTIETFQLKKLLNSRLAKISWKNWRILVTFLSSRLVHSVSALILSCGTAMQSLSRVQFFYKIDWFTWLRWILSQAETIITTCETEQLFIQNGSRWKILLFWLKIQLWICSVFPKGHIVVIFVSIWLRTQIWVKWVSQL